MSWPVTKVPPGSDLLGAGTSVVSHLTPLSKSHSTRTGPCQSRGLDTTGHKQCIDLILGTNKVSHCGLEIFNFLEGSSSDPISKLAAAAFNLWGTRFSCTSQYTELYNT